MTVPSFVPVTIAIGVDSNTSNNDTWMVQGRVQTSETSDIGEQDYMLKLYIHTDLIASPLFAVSLRKCLVDMVNCAHKDAVEFLESGYEDRNEWIYDNYYERYNH